MTSWREYWDGPHPIYVSERHRQLHFDLIARDIVKLFPSPTAVVLDYGCGEAWTAVDLARACGKLYLFDTAPTVRGAVAQRVRNEANITVLDETALAALEPGTIDLIVVNSVLQYLSRDELVALLDLARTKLKPSGVLALGDVIPENANALSDTGALLSFAAQGGFLTAALKGIVKTVFSDYRKLREQLGLTRYSETAMIELLRGHGFAAERAARNIGHNQGRMLFLARPA